MWRDREPYCDHQYVPDTFWLLVGRPAVRRLRATGHASLGSHDPALTRPIALPWSAARSYSALPWEQGVAGSNPAVPTISTNAGTHRTGGTRAGGRQARPCGRATPDMDEGLTQQPQGQNSYSYRAVMCSHRATAASTRARSRINALDLGGECPQSFNLKSRAPLVKVTSWVRPSFRSHSVPLEPVTPGT